MAFDGITVAAIVHELNKIMIEGRINKISQPEKDELLLTIKAGGTQYRLIMSANPSLPLVYLTEENKVSPAVAPTFTMLLRKHIQNGRIISITQPDFERIIVMEIEHLDEMGDICRKKLIIELMGKYSNIIFTDNEGKILDSIKHINAMTSSVREVLPGLEYFVPKQEGRINPITTDYEAFVERITDKAGKCDIQRAISSSFTGISPMIAAEICEWAELAADTATESVVASAEQLKRLWQSFENIMNRVKAGEFTPVMLYENSVPRDYCMIPVASYEPDNIREFDDVSALISSFYKEKEAVSRAHQKSADLRKIVQTILERDVKKYDLQIKQLKDTEKMEKFRIYGELLNTYGYSAEPGAKSITVDNYYTNEKMEIPLD
ncbi:MAG: NFACT family protein, partial [Lachnospiraceae bacterium]|nr:NFACT family protein [Candidatus Colinaster scatohippi]